MTAYVISSARPAFRLEWEEVLIGRTPLLHASSLAELRDVFRRSPVALAVVDVALFGEDRYRELQAIHQEWGQARLILGGGGFEPMAELSALAAGAVACCDRSLGREELGRIVDVVLQGGVWVSRTSLPLLVGKLKEFSGRQAKEPAPAVSAPELDGLTPREREVAELIGSGASNKQIARALDITDRTVKAHLTSIFDKLGVSDRLQLALYVTGRGPGS